MPPGYIPDVNWCPMPKCRFCNYDVHPSIGQCPHCGALMDRPNADLEQQVRALLDQGQKIAAVKLYMDHTGVGLADAKEAVEAMQAAAGPPTPPNIGSDLEVELLRLLGAGQKIQAVKLYKDQKDVGLAEAKQAVESLAAKHGLVPQRAGCLGMVLAVVVAAVATLLISVAAHAQQAAQQTTATASGQAPTDTDSPTLPMKIPVLVVKYFPVKGDRIDIAVTGDWGAPLEETRAKTGQLTKAVVQSLQEGSRYHGYKDAQARPSLAYEMLDEIEYLEPMPTLPRSGNRVPLTDYKKIMERVQIRKWVEERGVKEVWIWGYHGGVLDLWESNMASPYGDISNSNRDPNDLPVLKSTYTVYHYNYQRGASEAVEDHMHQLEAVLNYVDGRDRTPPDKWSELLFWGKFVGSDRTHKIVRPGCGWSHYPPNALGDYDWANKRFVETDIEDWKPDGTGKKQRMNCDRWSGDSLKWFVYWTQNIPGADNGLSYRGQPLTNWWVFIGDFDYAMQRKMTLVEQAVVPLSK